MRVKFTDTAKHLHTRTLLLRVVRLLGDRQVVVRPRLHALALIQPEHLLLVVLLEVVDDEVVAIRNVLLLAAEGQGVLQREAARLDDTSAIFGVF